LELKQLLFDFVKSPSLRHIRDPPSLHMLQANRSGQFHLAEVAPPDRRRIGKNGRAALLGDAAKTLAGGEGNSVAAAAAVVRLQTALTPSRSRSGLRMPSSPTPQMAGPGAADCWPDSPQRFTGGGATGG
jgi:hypothetical protein